MKNENPYLGQLVRRFHQRATAIFTEEMAGLDITPMQFATLNALCEHGPMDQARLAECIASDRATLGGIVDRLEAKRYLRRDIAPHDRRARYVSLTDEGLALFHKISPIVSAAQIKIAGNLKSAERALLETLLTKALEGADNLKR